MTDLKTENGTKKKYVTAVLEEKKNPKNTMCKYS